VPVAQHEKIVCNLRRNQGSHQAVTAPAAFPLVCNHAPAGVSRIATKHLLNFIEAKPDLSHGPLQTWFGSHHAHCSLTASGAIRTILGRGKKLVKAPTVAVSHWIGRTEARSTAPITLAARRTWIPRSFERGCCQSLSSQHPRRSQKSWLGVRRSERSELSVRATRLDLIPLSWPGASRTPDARWPTDGTLMLALSIYRKPSPCGTFLALLQNEHTDRICAADIACSAMRPRFRSHYRSGPSRSGGGKIWLPSAPRGRHASALALFATFLMRLASPLPMP
jgi:hypothetical protein